MTSEFGCETVSISKAEELSGGVSVHWGGHTTDRQTDTERGREGGGRGGGQRNTNSMRMNRMLD